MVKAGKRLVHGDLFILYVVLINECGVYHIQHERMQSNRELRRSITPAIMPVTPAQTSSFPAVLLTLIFTHPPSSRSGCP